MAEEVKQKSAKKVYSLEDIKFNEANKTMAILACIPVVGFILMLTEKEDKFVRYMGAQSTVAALVSIALAVLMIIPVLGILVGTLSWVYSMVLFVLVIVAMVKVSKGERYDFPVISKFALTFMAKF
jgi:uncharacterized membrane protein